GPGDHAQDQLVLRVVGDMVPPVAALVIGRVTRVAVPLLLVDVRPFLIELDRAGPRGKTPRARRAIAEHARPGAGRSGPPCRGARRPAARWPGPRCGRRGARRGPAPSPAAIRSGTAACPCARRSGPCRCDSRAGDIAGPCRNGRRRSGCRVPAGRSRGNRGAGSRSETGPPPWRYLRDPGTNATGVIATNLL